MPSLFKCLFVIVFIFVSDPAVHAQGTDYLMHGKLFSYCSFKKDCSGCRACEDIRYQVQIKNKQDKKIKSISYKVYSSLYDHTETRFAKIEGDVISGSSNGLIYICVPDIRQWFINEITYDDNTSDVFEIKGRLKDFVQETDECN